MRPSLAAMLALGAVATPVLAERGDAPFVVTYQCDGGRWLAVGYPAYRDARTAPIRIGYSGTTVLLRPAMSGSGARYTNDQADLEWWSKGDGGFLNRLFGNTPILTNCNAS